ncbi:hypothetical protein V5P93_005236 [Actinokineospora auranticolor]|uniref:Putative transporter (Transmembrane protein) n=1 Tax=Actinokineospora auranticolor TaxID=155976 RepID=A0A2S6GD02_9PSEU|nr:hypothetical protein [Actinokineospora auranticolor]PPK63092.1 putative transporter (transmembrane protein) [Actinokineospora auranticolor]
MAATDVAAVDIGAGFSDAWRMVITFVPRLLGFLLVLAVGYFIAKFAARVVVRVLQRVGFDQVAHRGGVNRVLARSRYDAKDIVAKMVYYAILLLTLQVAFGVWGANPISALLTDIVAWLPKAAVAVLIVVVAAAIARAVRDFVSNVLSGLSYGRTLGTAASVFITALGIIAALNQIGVATTVTTPVLITVLATAGGIAVVGVGGGLIRPMQSRWEGWLDRAGQEIPRMRESMETHPTMNPLREPAYSAAAQGAGQMQSGQMPSGQMQSGQYPAPGPMYGGPIPPQPPPGYPYHQQMPPYGQPPQGR